MTIFRIPCAILATALLTQLGLTTAPLLAQQYSFHTYGLDRGLTNLGIKNLYQDPKGFLWVSTENGIFRYDGERFQPYGIKEGLPPTTGAAFGEAPDGSPLVGGTSGLFKKTGERFERIPMPGAKSVFWFSGIQSDGKGTTWLATDAGLMAFTKDGLRLYPKPAGIENPQAYSLFVEDNAVWFGCDTKLCRLQTGNVTVFGPDDGLPPSQWRRIQRAGNGELWAEGDTELALLRPHRSHWESPAPPFPNGVTRGLMKDSGGRIIVGTNQGLAIRENDSWKTIGHPSGLDGSVYSILQDREGSIWIGLGGRGLVRWAGYRQWESFGAQSGLASEVVYEVFPLTDSRVWAGTEAGLFRGDRIDGAFTFHRQPRLRGIAIHSVRPDESGRLWLGTEQKGAARFDPATGAIEWFGEKQGLAAKNPYSLNLDSRNRIWAATENGLFFASLDTLRFRPTPQVSHLRVWASIEAPNGDIWAASDKGLFRLPAGAAPETGWIHIGTAEGLSHEVVLSLAAAKDGTIWAGYRHGGGIDRIRIEGPKPQITHIASLEQTVYSLGFDSRGRLWAGTDAGVAFYDGEVWTHYDHRDGLVWDDCDLGGLAASPDGGIWIGTSGGLARFTPQPTPLIYPPEVVFTSLILGGKGADPLAHPGVSHSSNMLHAKFSALAFARDGDSLYRYRLPPLFTDWRETRQPELQFDGIPAGEYRLEVQALDGWGHWSLDPAVFSFDVKSPWWRSPWWVALFALVHICLVILLSRLRVAALRKRELNLLLQVSERTEELKEANQHLLRLAGIEHEKELAEQEASHAFELAALNRRAIETLALAIEAKDQTTGDHLQRVEVYALEIAKDLGLDSFQREALRTAALLHDIGKLAVPEYIISKPGRLTPAEFEKMKIHTVVGAEIVELIHFPGPVAAIVRAHHEKWNGSGYPDGLSGDQIPIGARILAAVDCLDALSTDRQYRRGLPSAEAISIVQSEAGKSFDPAVVEVLARRYAELEVVARNAGSAERMKLSTDIKIVRGERPAAGFEVTAPLAATRSDLVSLNDSLAHDHSRQALDNLKLSIENWEERAEIFALLRQSLNEVVPYDFMALYLKDGDRLVPESCDGNPWKAFASVEIPMGTGLSGWVAENGKPSINGNPAVEPGYLADPERFRALRSALAVPLECQQQIVGVLSLYRTGHDAFSPRDLKWLLSLAGTLAEALLVRQALPPAFVIPLGKNPLKECSLTVDE